MPATPTGAGVSRILGVPLQGIQRLTASKMWQGTELMHPCGAAPQQPSSRHAICGTKRHELTEKGVSAHRPSPTGDHRRGLATDPPSPSWWRPSDNGHDWACRRSWPKAWPRGPARANPPRACAASSPPSGPWRTCVSFRPRSSRSTGALRGAGPSRKARSTLRLLCCVSRGRRQARTSSPSLQPWVCSHGFASSAWGRRRAYDLATLRMPLPCSSAASPNNKDGTGVRWRGTQQRGQGGSAITPVFMASPRMLRTSQGEPQP